MIYASSVNQCVRKIFCSDLLLITLTKIVSRTTICPMDITALSTTLSQQRVQNTAAIQIQKMAQNTAKDQGAALVKMMDSASVIQDPALGQNVNILA